jgi:hypothetical protein
MPPDSHAVLDLLQTTMNKTHLLNFLYNERAIANNAGDVLKSENITKLIAYVEENCEVEVEQTMTLPKE